MNHPARFQMLSILAALLWAGAAFAADAVPAPTHGGSGAAHAHGSSAELIRQHRLRHLDARLTTDPTLLQAQCRYESEIPATPPARQVVLTFDDGPEPGQTELILETLERHGISAVFFLIGSKAQAHPQLVERIRASGRHVIGNHSWDHPNFHAIDASAQALEVTQARDALPAESARFFRYPFGNATCETNALVHAMGYGIVGWHIDSCDWAYDRTGAVDAKEAMVCGVLPQYRQDYVSHVVSAVRAHHGGIVLMHEIHPHTVKQLDRIIQAIQAEGYGFSSIEAPGFAPSIR